MALDKRGLGVAFGLASMLACSVLPISSKYTLGYLDPLFFACATMLVGAVASGTYLAAKKRLVPAVENAPSFWKLLLFSYVITSLLFFIGQKGTSATISIIAAQIEAIFSVILAFVFLRERPHLFRVALVIAMLAAVVFTIVNGASIELGFTPSVLLIFGSAAAVQMGYFASKKEIDKTNSADIVFVCCLFGSLIFGLVGFALDPKFLAGFDLRLVPFLLFHGIMGWIVAYTTYYEAVKRIGISFATALLVPTPAISVYLANILLGEALTLQQIEGVALLTALLVLLAFSDIVQNKTISLLGLGKKGKKQSLRA